MVVSQPIYVFHLQIIIFVYEFPCLEKEEKFEKKSSHICLEDFKKS